jgi:hypothetical protein
MEPERIQAWQCEVRGVGGTLRAPIHTDVLAISNARRLAHERKSPDCAKKTGDRRVRVRETEFVRL